MTPTPASLLIGKILFFYTPLFPKEPQYIDLVPARATSAKAEKQMYLEPVIPGTELAKGFTRVGDHIAKVLDTPEQAEEFLARLKAYRTQLSAMNEALMATPAVQTQQRVRTVATPVS